MTVQNQSLAELGGQIRTSLLANELELAATLLERVPGAKRSQLPFVLLEARMLAARGQSGRALTVCEQAFLDHPENASVLRVLLRLLLDHDKRDEACAIGERVHLQVPENTEVTRSLIRLFAKSGRVEAAGELLERRYWSSDAAPEAKVTALLQVTTQMQPAAGAALSKRLEANRAQINPASPDADAGRLYRLASAEFRSGLFDQALTRLERGSQAGGLSLLGQALWADALSMTGRWEQALAVARAAQTDGLDRPDHNARIARILIGCGRVSEARHVLEAALTRWPVDTLLLTRANNLQLPPGDVGHLFGAIREHCLAADPSPPALDQLGLMALQSGDADAADAIFAMIQGTGIPPTVGPPGRSKVSGRFLDDRSKAVQTVSCPGAIGTLVVFPGLRNHLSGLPYHCLDAWFAALPLNVIYLRDFKFRSFLAGVEGLGDGPEASAAGLRQLAGDLGSDRLLMLGLSSGGFAAMRYGALAGADGVLAFAPLTQLHTPAQRPPVCRRPGRDGSSASLMRRPAMSCRMCADHRTCARSWSLRPAMPATYPMPGGWRGCPMSRSACCRAAMRMASWCASRWRRASSEVCWRNCRLRCPIRHRPSAGKSIRRYCP